MQTSYTLVYSIFPLMDKMVLLIAIQLLQSIQSYIYHLVNHQLFIKCLFEVLFFKNINQIHKVIH